MRFRHPKPLVLAVALAAVAACGRAEEWARRADSLQLPEPGVPLGSLPENAAVPLVGDRVSDAAHGPSPTTLDEFVALAMQNHPKLRAAQAAVEAARGKAVQARLYPNPQTFAGSPQATAPGTVGSSTQYFTGVQQEVVTAGKLRLQQQAALRDVQKAEYDLIRARYDVLRSVRQSYYQLLVAQRRLEIYKLLLDIARRSYDIGRQLAEAGEGTKADVLFWNIERDRAEVRLLNATVFIETGRRELAAAIGLPRVDIGKLEADLFQELPNFDLKQLQEAVVSSNAKPRYLRNRIRHEVLPVLRHIVPASVRALCRLADLCREDERYLDGVIADLVATHVRQERDGSWSFSRTLLRDLPEYAPIVSDARGATDG